MPKKSLLPPVDLQAGDYIQKITYSPCGCELAGKAPLPAHCPTHGTVAARPEVLVSVVLDESGSMGAVRESTIKAYNEYLYSLRQDGGNYLMTLTKFSTHNGSRTRVQYKNKPVQSAGELSLDNYRPMGGTPLYEAIGVTIDELKKEQNDRPVIMIILTDGEENSSSIHTAAKVKEMIKELEPKGWTFVYLGANQDAWQEGAKFGASAGSTYSFNTSNISATMANLGHATTRYARSYVVAGETERRYMSSNFSAYSGVKDIEADPGSMVSASSGSMTISVSNSAPPTETGAIGGKVAAGNMTPKQRSERARKAALAMHEQRKRSS